jgi:hypothetical protein
MAEEDTAVEDTTVGLRLDDGVVGATEAADDEELRWIEEDADELAPRLLEGDESADEVDAA